MHELHLPAIPPECNPENSITIDAPSGLPMLPAMQHASGFLKLVNEARQNVKELTLDQARARLADHPKAVLIDVREESEWAQGHAVEAVHLGKGILERDLEREHPDANTELILYCGGGYRSALSADAAQRMGYRNVYSLIGGFKAMVQAGWPMTH